MSQVKKSFRLRGAARDVLSSRKPEVLIAGPAGTGKSYGALVKLHLMCLQNGKCEDDCEIEHRHHDRGLRALIVRKTHASLTATGIVTYKTHVAREALEAGIVRWYGGSGSEPAQFIYGNDSRINVGGMDNPTKIMSSEYDVIFVQEATELTVTDWENCNTRLRNNRTSFQQLLADCNPQGPDHWLKRRCDAGKTEMLYGLHTDNPTLFDDEGVPTVAGQAYLDKLDALTGVRKLRLQGGIWAAAEGIIYEDWNDAHNLMDRKRLNRHDWRRIWGIDFGFVNPFVWQQWAIDPDGTMWLEKELYITQTLVEDAWRMILDAITMQDGVTWKYPKPDWIVCDHDAEDRATFERHSGLRTTAAIKNVSGGIQAMQQRIRMRRNGRPGLVVCRDSPIHVDPKLKDRELPTCFAQEITGYVWKPKPATSVVSATDKPTPDEPLKVNDHAMDTARYVVAQLDLRAVPNVRHL